MAQTTGKSTFTSGFEGVRGTNCSMSGTSLTWNTDSLLDILIWLHPMGFRTVYDQFASGISDCEKEFGGSDRSPAFVLKQRWETMPGTLRTPTILETDSFTSQASRPQTHGDSTICTVIRGNGFKTCSALTHCFHRWILRARNPVLLREDGEADLTT